MSSICISSCVNDTQAIPARVRATYVNLNRWPESEAEFIRSLGFRSPSSGASRSWPVEATRRGPEVVDRISCRQMYLRSYTFTREESVKERKIKCFGKVKHKLVNARNNKKKDKHYFAAFKSLFKKLLYCSASFDVVRG